MSKSEQAETREHLTIVHKLIDFKMSDSAAIEKKIEELEAEMARTQKNKATNYRECRRCRCGFANEVLIFGLLLYSS